MEYRKQLLEFQNIEKDFSAQKLVDNVKKPSIKKSVETMFLEVIEQMKQEKRIGNANFYKFAFNSLTTFNHGTMDILFTKIDAAWLRKYESWMKGNGNSINTMSVRFRVLRAIYNLAIQQRVVKKEYYPFEEFKVSEIRENTNKRAIPKEAIQKIINVDAEKITTFHTPLIELSKDIFLFSYLCCGINLVLLI